jgi:hypothetical protein
MADKIVTIPIGKIKRERIDITKKINLDVETANIIEVKGQAYKGARKPTIRISTSGLGLKSQKNSQLSKPTAKDKLYQPI